ncbi:uncharacterized protein LOC107614462 isoform X2 [Arachis ipaensis]|uniref:uncharacterized protein LOC107614462 isoform X2 n=1 Tax=Arachis ipaensis TaxID=130454 RepID=UPI000A2B8559|nr:uncharacterized protein LOC107614462 isoform X2 [Arachis ipaensis]
MHYPPLYQNCSSLFAACSPFLFLTQHSPRTTHHSPLKNHCSSSLRAHIGKTLWSASSSLSSPLLRRFGYCCGAGELVPNTSFTQGSVATTNNTSVLSLTFYSS